MINAFKTIRPLPSTTISFLSQPSRVGRKVTGFSFATASDQQQKMDKKPEKQNEKTGDVMSHSYGEGYASRCDEEGFGGTYGNKTFQKDDDAHENHPDYDKTQGSESKEKEKSRHQT